MHYSDAHFMDHNLVPWSSNFKGAEKYISLERNDLMNTKFQDT